MGAVGTGVTMMGQASAGRAQQQAAQTQAQIARDQGEYNARISETQAAQEREKGDADEAQRRAQTPFVLGKMRAGYAASGVTMEGSPLEALSYAAGQEELDAQRIRYNTDLRVSELQREAEASRYRGQMGVLEAQSRASTAATETSARMASSAISGVSSLLTSGGNFANTYLKSSTSSIKWAA